MTTEDQIKIRAFVMASDEEQENMRACALLTVGKPATRQPTFVLARLRSLFAAGLIYEARGGWYRSPKGKMAANTYLAAARAVMRKGAAS